MTDTPIDQDGPEPDPMPRMWLDETAGPLDMVTRKYADWHRRRAERAKMERDALAQALHSYGEHSDCCRSGEFTREVDAAGNAVSYPCICGFEDALERYPLAAKE